jgi:ribosomal protein S18 acetylase RimI-like enzyme
MSIVVRPATSAEYAEAGRVTALAYREFVRPGERAWEDYLERIGDVAARAQSAIVLVAVEEERILGSATLELAGRIDDDDPPLRPGEAHVRMLGVDPAERGRGVARALMDACAAIAQREGRATLTLHTTSRMFTARRMYEAMGFERLDDRFASDELVLLTYARRLSSPAAASEPKPS